MGKYASVTDDDELAKTSAKDQDLDVACSASDEDEWEALLTKGMDGLVAACASLCSEHVKAAKYENNPRRDDMLRDAIREIMHRTAQETAVLCKALCASRVSEAERRWQTGSSLHKLSDVGNGKGQSLSSPAAPAQTRAGRPEAVERDGKFGKEKEADEQGKERIKVPEATLNDVKRATHGFQWQDRCAKILTRAEDIYTDYKDFCADRSPSQGRRSSSSRSPSLSVANAGRRMSSPKRNSVSPSPQRNSISPPSTQRSSLVAEGVLQNLQNMHSIRDKIDDIRDKIPTPRQSTAGKVMQNLQTMYKLDEKDVGSEDNRESQKAKRGSQRSASRSTEGTRNIKESIDDIRHNIPKTEAGKGGTVDKVMQSLRIMYKIDQNDAISADSHQVQEAKRGLQSDAPQSLDRQVDRWVSHDNSQNQQQLQRGRALDRRHPGSRSSSEEEEGTMALTRAQDVQLQTQRRHAEWARKLDALSATIRAPEINQPRMSPSKSIQSYAKSRLSLSSNLQSIAKSPKSSSSNQPEPKQSQSMAKPTKSSSSNQPEPKQSQSCMKAGSKVEKASLSSPSQKLQPGEISLEGAASSQSPPKQSQPYIKADSKAGTAPLSSPSEKLQSDATWPEKSPDKNLSKVTAFHRASTEPSNPSQPKQSHWTGTGISEVDEGIERSTPLQPMRGLHPGRIVVGDGRELGQSKSCRHLQPVIHPDADSMSENDGQDYRPEVDAQSEGVRSAGNGSRESEGSKRTSKSEASSTWGRTVYRKTRMGRNSENSSSSESSSSSSESD